MCHKEINVTLTKNKNVAPKSFFAIIRKKKHFCEIICDELYDTHTHRESERERVNHAFCFVCLLQMMYT